MHVLPSFVGKCAGDGSASPGIGGAPYVSGKNESQTAGSATALQLIFRSFPPNWLIAGDVCAEM